MEFCNRIRETKTREESDCHYLILLTGKHEVEATVEALDNGADEFLTNQTAITEIRQTAEDLAYDQALANLDAVERIRDSLARHISEPLALEIGLLRMG